MNDIAQAYTILEISTTASPELAKQAYRKLAKIWHPDRYINEPILKIKAEEKIKKINQAYAVIKNHQEQKIDGVVKPQTTGYSSSDNSSTKVAKTKNTLEFYYQQGINCLESEDYNAALNSFAQVIKLNPNHLEAYQCRGFILSKLGCNLRANAEFEKARQIKLRNQVSASYGAKYDSQDHPTANAVNKTVTSLRYWRTLDSFEQPIQHLAICHRGKIATVNGSAEITLWQMDTGKKIAVLKGHADKITCLSISYSGRTLISGSQDKTIRFWDLESGKNIRTFGGYFDGHLGQVIALTLTRDNQTLLSCGGDNLLKIWNMNRAVETHNIPSPPRVTCLAISPDDRLFCSGSLEPQLQIRDIKTGQVVRSIDHSLGVLSLAFSRDGNLLATGGFDCNIKLWDIITGKQVHTLVGHTERISKVIFADDGKTLFSSSWDKTIKLWQLSTGTEISSIDAHSAKIHDLSISGDLKTIASSSDDRTVKLWRCN